MMLVVYGPTVTGKTNLALSLAKKYNGELISADSRQVYQGLDIGTGKVSPNSTVEKHKNYWLVDGVKVFGFDILNPGKQFTVADFIRFAKKTILKIEKDGKLPIVVGGTAFYIKVLLTGLGSVGIPASNEVRNSLKNQTVLDLLNRLSNLDKDRSESLNKSDRNNPRRLIRAIEIAMFKKNFKDWPTDSKKTEIKKPCILLGLTAPNKVLFDKADNWLDERVKLGLFEETDKLLKNGVSELWLNSLGLEYKWSTQFVLGTITKEMAIDRLKGDIHGFIRRQKTWFKQFEDIDIYDISKSNWENKIEMKLERHLSSG